MASLQTSCSFAALRTPRTNAERQTDFENAAYVVFVVLVTRAILAFGLNFYIPISKVREPVEDGVVGGLFVVGVVDWSVSFPIEER